MKKIFTWHVHGSYLYYLAMGDYLIYIPVHDDRSQEGYHGRGETFPFGDNVIEIAINDIAAIDFDCIVFQSEKNYLKDQYDILSAEQRKLPRIYLEHNTPGLHAVNTKHVVDDPEITLVHVTHYNKLMWDNNRTRVEVIEHGVTNTGINYTGELERGIAVINNLPRRGRIAGYDLFMEASKKIPIELIGMGTESIGLGEVLHPELPKFLSRYRFYFHPARYTSLGLSLLESMMVGLPIVGLATTELPMVITNGVSGFINTDFNCLIQNMQMLLGDKHTAITMGKEAQKIANDKYNIQRFVRDWQNLFERLYKKF